MYHINVPYQCTKRNTHNAFWVSKKSLSSIILLVIIINSLSLPNLKTLIQSNMSDADIFCTRTDMTCRNCRMPCTFLAFNSISGAACSKQSSISKSSKNSILLSSFCFQGTSSSLHIPRRS